MNSSSWEELINESESNMKKLAADKKYSFSIYRKMEAHIDSCLKEKNYAGNERQIGDLYDITTRLYKSN